MYGVAAECAGVNCKMYILTFAIPRSFCLNIFVSGIEYTEKDWVRLNVRHYPLQIWSVNGLRNVRTKYLQCWFLVCVSDKENLKDETGSTK